MPRHTQKPRGEKQTGEAAKLSKSAGVSKTVPRIITGSSIVSHRVLFSPNGKWLLCICGMDVRIYSCSTGELLSILHDDESSTPCPISCIAFNATSPHSQIYTVYANGRLLLWDYEDGIPVRNYQLPSKAHGVYSPYRNQGIFLLLDNSLHHDKTADQAPIVKEGAEVDEPDANSNVDTSCTLLYLSSFDKLASTSKKKGLRSIMRDISSDCHKVAFDAKGVYLAVINDNALCLHFFKNEQYKKHLLLDRHFTCIAIHPSQDCIATGDTDGRIILWRCFDDHSKVTKSILHWHSSSLQDLAFSPEGSYLWSGGWESTLVQWSLNDTDKKDFIPRMGAAILHLSISYDTNIIAVSHADNVLTLVGLQRNILSTISSLYWPPSSNQLHPVFSLEPETQCLVLRGRPGQLQLYDPTKDKLLPPIDVVRQNILTSWLNTFTNSVIDAVSFGSAFGDSWLCTADSLTTKHVGTRINLKFWHYDSDKRYIQKVCVIEPHETDPIHSILFNHKNSAEGGMLASLSQRNFKIWMATRKKTLTGSQTAWCCIGAGEFRGLRPSSMAFSPDGTTLAVAFGHLVTFWDAEKVCQRDCVLLHPQPCGLIRNILYGPDGSDIFITATGQDVFFWDLVSLTRMSIQMNVSGSSMSSSVDRSMCAVCQTDSVTVFHIRSGEVIYQNTFPAVNNDAGIISCLLLPGNEKENSLFCLYLLTGNGELWLVDSNTASTTLYQRLRRKQLHAPTELSPYAHLELGKTVSVEMNNLQQWNPQHSSIIDRICSVAAYTLPKPEHFLEEYLDSLLEGAKKKHGDDNTVAAKDDGMEMDVSEMNPGSDEENADRPAKVVEAAAELEPEEDDDVMVNPDQSFDFLRSGIEIFHAIFPPLPDVPENEGGGEEPTVTEEESGDEAHEILFEKMSMFYTKMRSG